MIRVIMKNKISRRHCIPNHVDSAVFHLLGQCIQDEVSGAKISLHRIRSMQVGKQDYLISGELEAHRGQI